MEDALSPTSIERLFHALGQQLEAAGERAAIVVVGGAALGLLGVVERTTEDVDVIAVSDPAAGAPSRRRLRTSEPFPPALEAAIGRVTRDFGLPRDWINSMVARQWQPGLPPGFAERVTWRSYGALDVGLAGRRDLIFLKLFAAVDQPGPANRHFEDLLALRPSREELEAAAQWVGTQDAAPDFPALVNAVVTRIRADTR